MTYFVLTILLIAFAMNFYVLARLSGLLGIKKRLIFWIVVIAGSTSLIGASILHSVSGTFISRSIYVLATGWYGVLWLLFCILILYEIIHLFVKIKPAVAGKSIILIAGCLVIYAVINAQSVRVKTINIAGPADLEIVQLSDIHIGSVSGKFVERLVRQTNSLAPDLVLITGDLVDNYNDSTQHILGMMSNFDSPVLFVTGNHEGYVGAERVIDSLRDANVTVLRNQAIEFDQIQIIGVEDNVKATDLPAVLKRIDFDKTKFNILMFHRPFELEKNPLEDIDLMLSGHTHAGQIFPFNFIVRNYYRPLYGLHGYNDAVQYVTSGTGTWGPRMRLGSRSEIVLIKIRPGKDQ